MKSVKEVIQVRGQAHKARREFRESVRWRPQPQTRENGSLTLMKLLVFSDIHSDLRALETLMDIEADYYFAAGDLVNWSRGLDDAGEVMRRRAGRMYVMPGNHESASQIAAFCAKFGFHDFHARSIELDGFHIAGLGYSNPTPFDTPGEFTEEQLSAHLAAFTALKPLILICHCPTKDSTLDRAGPGLHFGSPAIRAFLETHQPVRFFCGHIHEAWGATDKIGSTIGFNVGKKGYLLDTDTCRI